MLIDSHHHLWKYSVEQYGWIGDGMEVLKTDFLAAELRNLASENSVDGFVSVQARQTIEETSALLAIAAEEPLVRGVVGWVPLADAGVGDVLDQFAGNKTLVAVRHVVQDEPDDRFLLGKDFNRGVAMLSDRNLAFDVLVYARQLPATIEFVRNHHGLPMVLDHIAKPTILRANGVDSAWERDFRELAKSPNLMCKFSGVVTEVRDADWTIDTIRPYFDIALDAFTPDRLMFGSDWPVCLLKSEYSRWLGTVKTLVGELSADEQEKIFSGNAIRSYGLSS